MGWGWRGGTAPRAWEPIRLTEQEMEAAAVDVHRSIAGLRDDGNRQPPRRPFARWLGGGLHIDRISECHVDAVEAWQLQTGHRDAGNRRGPLRGPERDAADLRDAIHASDLDQQLGGLHRLPERP